MKAAEFAQRLEAAKAAKAASKRNPVRKVPDPATFWRNVEDDGACSVWTGQRDHGGYGRASYGAKQHAAHRLAFYLRLGRWPDGILRHLCAKRHCVLHVVEGTLSENQLDRWSPVWPVL